MLDAAVLLSTDIFKQLINLIMKITEALFKINISTAVTVFADCLPICNFFIEIFPP